jgi:hypothetical protein
VPGQGWVGGHSIAISFLDRGFTGPCNATVRSDGTFTFVWPSPASSGEHQVAVFDTGPAVNPRYPVFKVTPDSPPAAATVTVARPTLPTRAGPKPRSLRRAISRATRS